ncbi:hypothetical protein KEM55_005630 [Ascosphaera atra]|nr:hypothetical protein KEM55_005630 [Ascosphaera atra]
MDWLRHRLALTIRPTPPCLDLTLTWSAIQHHPRHRVGSHASRPAPVTSPAAPRVATVGPSAPADAPTGASLVGGSWGCVLWHGEQQLHVFRLLATVNGQAVAPLDLDAMDEREMRFLEKYGESAFCADWRGHSRELCGAQELNAVLYQVSTPASATPCTR